MNIDSNIIRSQGKSLMYSRKGGALRKKPSGTPALTGYSCEDFHPELFEATYD